MLAPINPRSAALPTSSRESFQSCFSSSSMRVTTSLSTNCRVVSAIMRCSSVKSSGVKISSGVRSSIRNAPPLISFFYSATADIVSSKSGNNPCNLWLKSFKNSRGAHAAPDTHRHHSISSIAALELAQDAGSQLRARATERMAQRDRAAIDVDLIRVQSQRLNHCDRLCRERFVQLDHINIGERQARELQNLRNRENWSNAHLLRRTAGSRVSNEARHRLRTQLTRARVRHYDRRSSTVRHLRRVAG